jgi:hypothetical protein
MLYLGRGVAALVVRRSTTMFDTITCPECGYIATVLERFHLASTDGAVEHLSTSCINGHYFTLRIDAEVASISADNTGATPRRPNQASLSADTPVNAPTPVKLANDEESMNCRRVAVSELN